MNRHNFSRFARLLCALVLAALVLIPQVGAEAAACLNVHYGCEQARLELYYVAAPDEEGWRAEGDFANFPVVLPGPDGAAGQWRAAAQTLAALAAQQNLPPTAEAQVKNGQAAFCNLQAGLYLITGPALQQNGTVYAPVPALVGITGTRTIWVKAEQQPTTPLTYQVVKRWNGGLGARPQSVTVQLIQNGADAGQVTLSAENGWSYRWRSDPGVHWQVVEQSAPAGFTVAVEQNANVFTITNTYAPPGPTPPSGQLPQTGQLWWPAAALLVSGGLLAAVGRRKKGRSEATCPPPPGPPPAAGL